jgi:uncharacterized protein DUF1552
MNTRNVTRRRMLQGGAVALGLPWLETFAPRNAKAAGAAAPVRRYMNIYFPNGTTDMFWLPGGVSAGTPLAAKAGPFGTTGVSPILEPLAPSNKYMLVLGGVGNYSAYGGGNAQPSHGTNCGPSFHGFDSRYGMKDNGVPITDALPGGGISVDQIIAAQIGSQTKLPSLQVGLSTLDSYCDGSPCVHARSMSWSGPNMPMGRTINPQAVFDLLVSAGAPTAVGAAAPAATNTNMPNPALAQTRALQQSVLDAVLDSATTLATKVSTGDQARLDQYMTSVRDLEKLVAAPAMQVTGSSMGCTGMTRPPEAYADMMTPPDYSRETHANLMIQLITMAFACDLTRTVTLMMDDSRSEFVYSHVPVRLFNTPAAGMLSSPGTGTCTDYHGLQHAGDNNDGFASITWWMSSKVNQMVQALVGLQEGTGTVMDTTVIHYGSGMHGGNHDGLNIPVVLMGTGGGVLKTGQYINTWSNPDAPGGGVRLMNLHLTLIQKVFGSSATSIGNSIASTTFIPELLA